MQHFGGFGLALLCATGLFGQIGGGYGGGHSPVVSSGFGQVLSPARRSIGTLPAGGHAGPYTGAYYGYGYPVYVGSYGYLGSNGYADPPAQDAYGQDQPAQDPSTMAALPQQPGGPPPANVTVVYPAQTTVIINQTPDGGTPNVTVLQGPPAGYGPPPSAMRRPPAAGPAAAPAETPTGAASSSASYGTQSPNYLIAFKDHTIYSAVAYWVDGDTLHYFTTPTTHNQVSLALVDRDLTARLNHEAGVDLKLPPADAK